MFLRAGRMPWRSRQADKDEAASFLVTSTKLFCSSRMSEGWELSGVLNNLAYNSEP